MKYSFKNILKIKENKEADIKLVCDIVVGNIPIVSKGSNYSLRSYCTDKVSGQNHGQTSRQTDGPCFEVH